MVVSRTLCVGVFVCDNSVISVRQQQSF